MLYHNYYFVARAMEINSNVMFFFLYPMTKEESLNSMVFQDIFQKLYFLCLFQLCENHSKGYYLNKTV